MKSGRQKNDPSIRMHIRNTSGLNELSENSRLRALEVGEVQ